MKSRIAVAAGTEGSRAGPPPCRRDGSSRSTTSKISSRSWAISARVGLLLTASPFGCQLRMRSKRAATPGPVSSIPSPSGAAASLCPALSSTECRPLLHEEPALREDIGTPIGTFNLGRDLMAHGLLDRRMRGRGALFRPCPERRPEAVRHNRSPLHRIEPDRPPSGPTFSFSEQDKHSHLTERLALAAGPGRRACPWRLPASVGGSPWRGRQRNPQRLGCDGAHP